ncbi:hypothetical protein EON65_01165 [archaeon]|nr:MAG: hypothetical protein EON65_01165 [archaeon]
MVETLIYDDEDGDVEGQLPRSAGNFQLRVTGFGGALVREGIEIEGSRVIFVAEMGTELEAHERKANNAGLIRYRTKLGWISEYRRDQQKSAIVEVLSIGLTNDATSKAVIDESSRLLSLREACSVALLRTHSSLRQIGVNLARIIASDSPTLRSRSSSSMNLSLTSMLTNVVKSFMEQADVLVEHVNLRSGRTSFKASGGHPYITTADAASTCLFLGSVIRHIVASFVEDKNGYFNLMLLRSFCNSGLLKNIFDSLTMVWHVLEHSIKVATMLDGTLVIDTNGRCALYAITQYNYLLKKLANRELFNKSTTNWSSAGAGLQDENGVYHSSDLLTQLITSMCDTVIGAFEKCLWNNFPPIIQYELLQILGDLVANLGLGIPPIQAPLSRQPSSLGRLPPSLGSPTGDERLSALRALLGGVSTPTVSATPPQLPAVIAPPPPPPFNVSDEVVSFLSSDLGFDRGDVIAVMNYLRTNEIEQVADVISQGDDSGVLLNARAAAASAQSAPPPAPVEPAQRQTDIITLSPASIEQSDERLPSVQQTQPVLPLPLPPTLPFGDEVGLPNLVSALGQWDSVNEEVGVGISSVMDESALGVLNRSRMRHNTIRAHGRDESDTLSADNESSVTATLLSRIKSGLSVYVLDACKQFSALNYWDQLRPDYLVHQLSNFLVKLAATDKTFSIQYIVSVLVTQCSQFTHVENNSSVAGDFYAHLLLLTLILRKPVFRSYFKDETANQYTTLCKVLVEQVHTSPDKFVASTSSIMILLHEYFLSNIFGDSYVKEELGRILLAPVEQTEEGAKDQEPGMHVELSQLKQKSFDLAVALLNKHGSLDYDAMVAIIILVTHLISDQQLASRFVKDNHLLTILTLPFSAGAKNTHEKLLGNLLVAACKDASELYVDIASEVKTLLSADDRINQKISLEKFLRGMSTRIIQNPPEFFFI